MQRPEEIIVAGAGKLASALIPALQKNNAFRVFCWGRNSDKTKAFAATHNAQMLENTAVKRPSILCVSDSAIAEVANQLSAFSDCLIHTSGNNSIDILTAYSENAGVMWPVQSFTEYREVDWKEIPLLVEFSGNEGELFLRKITDQLGGGVTMCDSKKRRNMHLAAVFVNNFWNHLAVLSDEWCEANGLNGKLLLPLMKETAAKLLELKPAEAQTGPARRHDEITLKAHLALVENFPELKEVYALLSHQIGKRY